MARSKIGFHTGPGGNKNGLGAWERALNGAGQAFGMKAADEYGPIHEAVQIGREHGVQNWLGFRFTRAAGRVSREVPDYDVEPGEDARRLCQETLNQLPDEFDKSVWLEIINEPRAQNKGADTMFNNMNACDYLGEWCLAAARFLNERGYKFMGPSFNSGEPGREGHPLQDAVRQYAQPGMLKFLRYCATNPDQAALSVHEYSWSNWQQGQTASDWYPGLWGRFEAAIAAADLNGIPRTFHIFVTEFGFAHREAPAGPAAWPLLDARNRMTARWPQLKYDASWTLQAGWGAVDNHVNTWMQYDARKQFDEGQHPARTHAEFGASLPGVEPAPEPAVAADTEPVTPDESAPVPAGRDIRSVTAEAGLNLRRGPSIEADIKRRLPFRTVVEVLEDGPWARVRAGGDVGFVSSEHLSAAERPAPERPRPERTEGREPASRNVIGTKKVTAPRGLQLRSGPTPNDSVIISMQKGTVVEVIEEGEWDFIRVSGEEGYASSEWLSALTPAGAVRPRVPERTGEGFDSPVGTAEERRGGKVWPSHWIDATLYLKEYTFGQPERTAFHTGADLNLNFPHQDADKDKPVYACAVGVVTYARLVPDSSWGKLVVIRHMMPDGRTVHSRYGHLKRIMVEEGQRVERGRQVGTIGGVDYGLANHLHFDISLSGVLERNPTHWPGHNEEAVREHYVDPRQFIRNNRRVASPARPERPATAIDLLPYIKGDGRQYEVRNSFGSQERFQTREEGQTFYLVKNAQWEQFFYDDDFIYRDTDTSPGGGRYYRLTDPDRQQGSRWLRRRMAVGETHTQQRRVQFYNKADGTPSAANSGSVTDTIKLVAHHGKFRFQTEMEVEDVLEFHWVKSESDHTPKEKYYYARGLGMVGWARAHEDPNSPSWSAVSEIHERGTREEIPREKVTLR